MAKARSPQYPAIGLKEAIERATEVYNNDYQNPIPRSVAAAHMGYQSLNGKSLGVLSAVLKYGLLEGRGDQTRVSDLAVSIIAHPPGSGERVGSLREAASNPELFAELDARFQGGKASDQALRSYLLTQKFIPTAADAAIRSYRETKQLLEAESSGYDIADIASSPVSAPSGEEVSRSILVAQPTLPNVPTTPIVAGTSGRQAVTISWVGEKGVSESSIAIKDDRLELAALLYDQAGVQKVIDRLSAMKALLPEKTPDAKEEAAD
ncbi:hypothetical protein [Bradyrhizobium sp. HKCCYLR20261]|uniref:hypothetical protein n=1 Tax=Bradyrhizobium sp. HKCCYLR20261 TaxID=3420760 RepID=UPI003EB979B1